MVNPLPKRLTCVIAAVAAVVGVAAVASASVPATGATIHSCVGPGGYLRVIDPDAGERCRRGERRLAWNQRPPTTPVIRAGLCRHNVPKSVRAGATEVVHCRYDAPMVTRSVVVTPAFSDSFAEPVYVLRPGVDYAHEIDLDSGTDRDFVVLVRILREITAPFPTPDVDHHALLLTYLATGQPV